MDKTTINFLGIGAQKAGTSWLHKNLQQHPEIWMPPRKELHYFDREITYPSPSFLASNSFQKRIHGQEKHNQDFREKLEKELTKTWKSNNKQNIEWYLNYFLGDYSDEWYHSLFENGVGKVSGEITPAYSFLSIKDIQHIHKLYPKLKIILILRNPIDRAWSQFRFYINLNILSQESSIEEIKKFIDSKEQTLRGDYISIISNWSKVFPKEQLHICFYDEIQQNPQLFLNKIFNFLNIKPLLLEEKILKQKVNISHFKDIPQEIQRHLNQKYKKDIIKISEIIGSYSKKWIIKE
jgi:hypothetical protein